MKPLKFKFDLSELLEDIAMMSPEDLGIERALIIIETDEPAEKSTTTKILMAGDNVLDASGMIYRAMGHEPKLTTAITLAIATYMAEQKERKL